MNGIRRAAAALYGLHDADRAAILAQLAPAERAPLQAALHDLASLGFDRLMFAGLQGPGEPGTGVAGSARDDLVEQLAGIDPARVLAALRDEPAPVVAAVLRLGVWPWSRALMTALPARTQAEIKGMLHNAAGTAPGLRTWLLRELLARARLAEVASPAGVAPATRRFGWLPWAA